MVTENVGSSVPKTPASGTQESLEATRFKELIKTRLGQLTFWQKRVADLRSGNQVIEWSDLDDKRGRGDREVVSDEEAVKILRAHPDTAKRYFNNTRKEFVHPRKDSTTTMAQALDLPAKNKELGNPATDEEIRNAQLAELYYIALPIAQLEALDRLEKMLEAKA